MKKYAILIVIFLWNNVLAQTSSSFADISPALENSLATMNNIRDIEVTDGPSVISVSFAMKIVLPDNVTSLTFDSATFTLVKKINGGILQTQLNNISMAASKFNPEGDASRPSIFARNAAGNIIVPSGNLVGTVIPNPKSFFITEHNVNLGSGSFPKLVLLGDRYEMWRTLSGSYVLGGVSTPFSFTERAKVQVSTRANVTVVYQTKADTPLSNGGSVTLKSSYLSPENYLRSWFIQTSEDRESWILTTDFTVSGPNITISFPGPHQYWRIVSF